MRERLYQTIYDDLLRKIKTGVYAQNDKLPTEHELTGLYGVSRVTTMEQDCTGIGAAAAERLLALMDGGKVEPLTLFDAKLIERASVRKMD